MLRVSDIFPQAASGSLADVVGSCIGRLCAASGSLVWLCCWRDAWPALSSWIPFPSDSPWVLWSFILCKSLVQSLDELSQGKTGPFLTVASNDQLKCDFRYSGKPIPQPNFFNLCGCLVLISVLIFTPSTSYPNLIARGLAERFCVNVALSDFYVAIYESKIPLFPHIHHHKPFLKTFFFSDHK